MASSLYIIDGHAYIYAAYYAPMRQRLTGPSGEPTKATYIFTTMLVGLMQRREPDMLAVAMDSKTPTFRSDIYPEYKAHRPPMPDDMPGQIARIEQILEVMRVAMLRAEGYEADDVMGTLARKAAADGHEVFLCSGDKDILQLLDNHISVFNIKTGEATSREGLLRKTGLTPEQQLDCLALQGDTSDNIPGVPDVGPKTAVDWIRRYGSLDNLIKHAGEIEGKRGENLRKFADRLDMSKRLVTIDCDVPLAKIPAFTGSKTPRGLDYKILQTKAFDDEKLKAIFTELGFTRLLSQLRLGVGDAEKAQAPPAEAAAASGPAAADTVRHDYVLVDTPGKFEDFLGGLKKKKIFVLDTETTSTDPMKAKLVGISFCWKSFHAFYLPVAGPLGAKCLDAEKVKKGIGPILADAGVMKVGQNIKYDRIVLENAGMPIAGIRFDTMVASYCLDPTRKSNSMDAMALDYLNYRPIPLNSLIGKGRNQVTFDAVDTAKACEYAAEDADVTWRLYEYLADRIEKKPALKKLFFGVEMPLVDVLAQMEINGVSIDTKLLRAMSDQLTESMERLAEKIHQTAGTVFNIDSPRQLSEVLFDRLGLRPVRVGKTGLSTDSAVLDELAGEHPVIELVSRYRMLGKLRNTYTDKLGAMVNARTGRLHTSFNQTITATGRLSSSDPNLQNIPIRTELGKKIRAAFVPKSKSDCILSADYSQIELRMLAHFSMDQALLDAFEKDQDIHTFVASQIYGVELKDVTPQMRSVCKAVNFGIIYGQGPYGLSRTVGISQAEAKKFIDRYFARYGSIRSFFDRCVDAAKKTGCAETILGRRRPIENLESRSAARRSQARRLAVNTVIQGSAADLIKVAMLNIQHRIDRKKLPVKMIMQIHDELVFELPGAEAEKHCEWISDLMTSALELNVPLKVDVAWGPTWR